MAATADDHGGGPVVVDLDAEVVGGPTSPSAGWWRPLAIVAAVAAAGVVLLSIGDDGPEDDTAPSTTTTAPDSTAPPTSVAADPDPGPTLRVANPQVVSLAGAVDVASVPVELSDDVLLAFDPAGDVIAALHFGTGELVAGRPTVRIPRLSTMFEVGSAATFTSDGVLLTTGGGAVLVAPDLSEVSPAVVVQDVPEAGQTRSWSSRFEISSTVLVDARTGDEVALPTPGFVQPVGADGEAALINSPITGAVHRVDPDGRVERAVEGLALAGGEGWVLVSRCSDDLVCGRVLVDLRSGDEVDVSGDASLFLQPVAHSVDGRRGIWVEFEPTREVLRLIDADEPSDTVLPSENVFRFSRSRATALDPDLTHAVQAAGGRLRIIAVETGDVTTIELPDALDEVIGIGTSALVVVPADGDGVPALADPAPVGRSPAMVASALAGLEAVVPVGWWAALGDPSSSPPRAVTVASDASHAEALARCLRSGEPMREDDAGPVVVVRIVPSAPTELELPTASEVVEPGLLRASDELVECALPALGDQPTVVESTVRLGDGAVDLTVLADGSAALDDRLLDAILRGLRLPLAAS